METIPLGGGTAKSLVPGPYIVKERGHLQEVARGAAVTQKQRLEDFRSEIPLRRDGNLIICVVVYVMQAV